MGLHGILKVNKTEKLNAPIGAIFKASLAVPHIHQSADDSLGLAVGLRTIDAGKLLTDTVLPASFIERMAVSFFKFFAVVRTWYRSEQAHLGKFCYSAWRHV